MHVEFCGVCSWSNGTRYGDGVKVLWCHSLLVWSLFEGCNLTYACCYPVYVQITFCGLFLLFLFVFCYFFFKHNHIPSGKKTTVTGMQVVTTSQVQIIGCRSKAIL